MLLSAIAGSPGCNKSDQPDQNIIITNEVPANAEVEALPPDESSATPTDELESGDDQPDVNELGNDGNLE